MAMMIIMMMMAMVKVVVERLSILRSWRWMSERCCQFWLKL